MSIGAGGFQDGDDFISFGRSPSPPVTATNAEAGPSRLPSPPPAGGKKGKGRAAADEALLARKKGLKRGAGPNEGATPGRRDVKRAKNDPLLAVDGDGDGDGDEDDRTGPRNLKQERKAAERGVPWAAHVDWGRCKDPAEMLNAEITAFHRYISPTEAEFEVRLLTIERISRAILTIWPDAEIHPFGSWQTQLYLPQGDIDLVVSNKHFTESGKARMLAEMARAVRAANITDNVAIISKAKVPIIKFVTRDGQLAVDISLNQTNGIAAGEIINHYLDVLPGARPLILVVKAFLSQRSMNEVFTGGLGSYSVICLVISFLQVHPKLRRSEIDPESNLGTLLVEFFELYGRNFNYDEVGISIRKGGFYYSKSRRDFQRNQAYLLSIEDPQDQSNDISRGSFGIRQVRATFGGAFQLLQGKLFERAGEMSREGREYASTRNPEDLSILAGVMGVTKDVIKQRQEMQVLHSDNRLRTRLNIPHNADLSQHVRHYRPPPAVRTKSTGGRGARPRAGVQPKSKNGSAVEPSRARKGSPLVQAIIVDDDEVIDVPDSSDEGGADVDDYDDLYDDDDDDDDDEVEEEEERDTGNGVSTPYLGDDPAVIASRRSGKVNVDQYYDISDDTDADADDDFEVIGGFDSTSLDPTGEDDSRYALGSKSKAQPGDSAATKAEKKEKMLAKKAFWAGKAGRDLSQESDEEGEISVEE